MNRSMKLLAAVGVAVLCSPIALAQDPTPPAEGEGTEETTETTEAEAPAASSDFSSQIGTMEEQVNTLKEQVFRSKATLQLLKEIVIQGGSTGARSVVYHENGLGPAYTVESVSYYLDGQSIFSRSDPTGALDKSKELKVWEGYIPPGSHTLTTNMVLQGNGFGVFKYVDGYTFKVTSTYAFSAEEGRRTQVRVRVDEKGGFWTKFEDRPTIVYEVSTVDPSSVGEQD